MTATFAPIYTPIPRADKPGLDLTGGGRKIVLHTTEGPGNVLPFSWYGTSGYIPNYTVSLPLRQWHRHLPNDKGAYTLVDGNRWGDRVIQIEVCGRAQTIDTDFTHDDWVWFGETIRQLCDQEGIPWDFCSFVSYPASYGLNAAQRLDIATYTAFAGICGHQHVPKNDHGDLGAAPIEIIKAAGTPTPKPPLPPGEEDMPSIRYRIKPFAGETTLAPGAWLSGQLVDAIKAGVDCLVESDFHAQALASQLKHSGLDDRALSYHANETITAAQRTELAAIGITAP
jgi:hypothetical protein